LWFELGRRTGDMWNIKDAHNLYLHLLLEVGIAGAAAFFAGLYLCARAAWRARMGAFGFLPMALLVTILSANLTHTYLTRKPQWLFLALMVGLGAVGRLAPVAAGSRFKVQSSRFKNPERYQAHATHRVS
jgi:O-antigen ligase